MQLEVPTIYKSLYTATARYKGLKGGRRQWEELGYSRLSNS